MAKQVCPSCSAEVFPTDAVCMDCGAPLRRHQPPPAGSEAPAEVPGKTPAPSSRRYPVAALVVGAVAVHNVYCALHGTTMVAITVNGRLLIPRVTATIASGTIALIAGLVALYLYWRWKR